MKKSKIEFEVTLDQNEVPEKISWKASDNPAGDAPAVTKSVSISLWDHLQKNTLRIDLWTKDMPVDEMKRFYIDVIGGLAQSALTATGDEFMSAEMNALCDKLVEHLKKLEMGGST
jgi:gliding motility-associated protein GldC